MTGASAHAHNLRASLNPNPNLVPIRNPANHGDVVGWCQDATAGDIEQALSCATAAAAAWAATRPGDRATLLEAAANGLEIDIERLVTLLVSEAGKTCANAAAEVREAVDFLRYYAHQVRRDFNNASHLPLGPVVCISPWNFPLAIFTGQVAAALAAGNPVLAKPAEQTPLVAAQAVRALHAAGVPCAVLQLLPGRGETIGAALVADARVQAVLFTGSSEVARLLQTTLSQRLGAHGLPVPLIAETGGQNAMLVDSSALAEQVVSDVIASAFESAGQRCSALRVLCVQRELAPRLLEMLEGAVHELQLGDPRRLCVDVGPVIDEEARAGIERHIEAMRAKGRRVARPMSVDDEVMRRGTFVAPALIEIERLDELTEEVFGPVLHILRYERDALPDVLKQISETGYGLTLGVHTRIDETAAQVISAARTGNVYVNRNIVGAVVGVQPFGGEGLSGTGPKAGGPLYLLRLLAQRPGDAAARAVEQSGPCAEVPIQGVISKTGDPDSALLALRGWALEQGRVELIAQCDRFARQSTVGRWRAMAGPTGEANFYALVPREVVLCLTQDAIQRDARLLQQLAAVLAVGSRALWSADCWPLWRTLPLRAQDRVTLVQDWRLDSARFDAVLFHGETTELMAVCRAVAARKGAIVGVIGVGLAGVDIPLERLVLERSLSINTAAAGGNVSLMMEG